MQSRKISVQLDGTAARALNEVLDINGCTISDAINAAIVSFSKDKQPVIMKEELHVVIVKIQESNWRTIDNYCDFRKIDKSRLRYLLKRTAKGHNVCGFGNTVNKHRDKNDDRLFKTHTAYIADCVKKDFGVEL